MSYPSLHLPVPPPQPAPPSYRLAAVDALRRGDRDVYRVLSSQPGVGANPLIPTEEEVADSMDVYSPFRRSEQKRCRTCLDMAAREGRTQTMETVLGGMSTAEKETELDVEDEDGATALWYAASKGHTDIVRMLCETGCVEVDKVRHHELGYKVDSTPLMAATRDGGCADTLSVLLSFGADPNYRRCHARDCRDDSSVLEALCRQYLPSVEAVRVLLESGADPNSHSTMRGGTPYCGSALMQSLDKPEVVAALIEYGADVNYRRSHRLGQRDDSTVLHEACHHGDPLSARLLCEAGADVTATTTLSRGHLRTHTPLAMAIFHDQPLGAQAVLLSTGKADPFAWHPNLGRPLIDLVAARSPASVVLMDSRPYVDTC